jgi:uncharacterized membrane protein
MSATPTGAHPPSTRLDSVDLLRGLVMVVMALDHTRDYFHHEALLGLEPLDFAQTTAPIFLTRWITHFCAPLFSFLAGTGVFLSFSRGKSKRELSWFLVTRGLWLILLELTFVRWAWNFSYDFTGNWGLVLWALGWSMIALAGLIHLPLWLVAAFSGVMIAGHNALDAITPSSWGSWAWLWQLLHVPGEIKVTPGFSFLAYYPLVPWIGVMAAGYCFGAVIRLAPDERRAWLLRLGLGMTAVFVALRFSNLYGDPRPWSPQSSSLFTVLSFLDCAKYPPSLLYLLMTLGPGLLLLAAFDRGVPVLLQPVLVFGRVPFFYYMLHIPLIHGLAYALHHARHGTGNIFAFGAIKVPPDAGVGLVATYAIWLAIVIALYPACRWFAELKRRRRDTAWLSYF